MNFVKLTCGDTLSNISLKRGWTPTSLTHRTFFPPLYGVVSKYGNLKDAIVDVPIRRMRIWRKLCQIYLIRIPNQDKPEITNYKHQIINKSQITISKSQIRSKANCLEF
jgi:hypothetical protein